MDVEAFLGLIAAGDQSAVEALRADPALAAARASNGATALQWAVYNGHSALVPGLRSAGALVDFPTACTIGDQASIPNDVDVNEMSPDGFRPLCLAVAFGNNAIAQQLVDSGADVNLPSVALGGVAPIHAAVFGRNLEAIKILVAAGANVNATQEGGFTALMGAAQNGDSEMVRYLLDNGADPTARTGDGKTAADLAKTDELRKLLSPKNL